MKLKVLVPSGKLVEIDCEPSTTINELFTLVSQKTGIDEKWDVDPSKDLYVLLHEGKLIMRDIYKEFVTFVDFRRIQHLNLVEDDHILNRFAPDSKLQVIDKEAFHNTCIFESFTVPPHLKKIGEGAFGVCGKLKIEIPSDLELELKEQWCDDVSSVSIINVGSNNPFFINYNDQLVLKKSSINAENFDELVFCSHEAKSVIIPSFVKIIDASAFSHCYKLINVEFEAESELQKIGKNAFYGTSIKSFKLPPKVKQIEGYTFYYCKKLKYFAIPQDSELLTI